MQSSTPSKNLNELFHAPLYQASDLGKPLPPGRHATSVAMPLWAHVVAYEEGDLALRAQLACGYPRFVVHPLVAQLFAEAERQLAAPGERAFVFPSQRVAQRCADFIGQHVQASARVAHFASGGLCAVLFPETAWDTAKRYWQHYGEIVSSRWAESVLEDQTPPQADEARQTLRERIATHTGGHPSDVFFQPTGMGALTAALRLAQALRPGLKTAQLGFPYVDLLKIQHLHGQGVHFLPRGSDADIEALEKILDEEQLCAVFCEVPGNPLLQSVNLPRLSALLRRHGVPLVVDDTVGTFHNIAAFPHADLLTSSLTKFFSGTGDVMAGSLVINPDSPHAETLRGLQQELHEELFWDGDVLALEQNSGDFDARMDRINATTEAVCAVLKEHPLVERLYYPKYETPEAYRALMKPGAGYSGLFSIELRDPARHAQPFYDALRVSKGPSLGNNFTLACPYVLLAHYDELDWAESVGLSRYLVRVSVGLECAEDLIARFHEALEKATA